MPVETPPSPTHARRQVLIGSGAALVAAAACTPPVIRPPRGGGAYEVPRPPSSGNPNTAPPPTTTTAPIPTPTPALMLAKCTYGRTAEADTEIAAMGWSAWLDAQLNPTSISDSAMTSRLADFVTLNASNFDNRDRGGDVVDEVRHSQLLRALYSRRQLYEIMVDFWSNHFNIGLGEWFDFMKAHELKTVAQAHALGKFKDMVLASARSPHMLLFLDNAHSDASNINENYGRELLELHTLGITNGTSVYTEADVRAVATVLAGWTINWTTYEYRFSLGSASRAAISILGGAWSRPARPSNAQTLEADGVSLIDFLAHHPSTARYLARKLCRRFVSDEPSDALVESAAQVYLANDTAIAPVLRHILTSAEFATSGGRKLRRPFELLVAQGRATGVDVGSAIGRGSQEINWRLEALGNQVFGWLPPDGFPDIAPRWTSSQAMLLRWRTAARLVSLGFQDSTPDPGEQVYVNLPGLFDSTAANCGELIDRLALRLVGLPLSAAERAAILTACSASATTAATHIRNNLQRRITAAALVLSVSSFQRR